MPTRVEFFGDFYVLYLGQKLLCDGDEPVKGGKKLGFFRCTRHVPDALGHGGKIALYRLDLLLIGALPRAERCAEDAVGRIDVDRVLVSGSFGIPILPIINIPIENLFRLPMPCRYVTVSCGL